MARESSQRFVILQSVPRSGSSWLGQILNSCPRIAYRYQPIHSYTFAPILDETSREDEVHDFFDALALSDDPYINMCFGYRVGGVELPNFDKQIPWRIAYKETHDFGAAVNALSVCNHVMMIGLVRNPIDAIDSWFRNPSEFDPRWQIDDEWWDAPAKNAEYRGNLFGLEHWIETTRQMVSLNKTNERFKLVRYEELLEKPDSVVQNLFDWLGIPLEEQTLDFLSRSTNESVASDNPYSIFRDSQYLTSRGRRLPRAIQDRIVKRVRDAGLSEFVDAPK